MLLNMASSMKPVYFLEYSQMFFWHLKRRMRSTWSINEEDSDMARIVLGMEKEILPCIGSMEMLSEC